MFLFLSQELFPVNRQSVDHFAKYFTDAGLKELSDFLRVQQSLGTRKELQKELQERLSQECPIKEVGEHRQTPLWHTWMKGGGAVQWWSVSVACVRTRALSPTPDMHTCTYVCTNEKNNIGCIAQLSKSYKSIIFSFKKGGKMLGHYSQSSIFEI